MKYGELQEPKPPRFPLFIDLKPEKNSNLNKVDTTFNDVLSNNLDSDHKPTEKAPKQAEKIAISHSTLQTSIIQQGIKHLPHSQIAAIEQIGQKQNSERVGESTYINYAAAFQAGFSTTTLDSIKRRKKQLDQVPLDEQSDPENPSKGTTYSHNLNLFYLYMKMKHF